MSVFLSSLLLIVVFAVSGHRIGAVRGVVGLLGILVGGLMAVPLSPYANPLLVKAGSTNPLWNWVLPPLIMFVLIQIVFGALALFAHHRVMLFYKYKATDEVRHRWERMNSRVGVAVGVGSAVGYILILGTIVFALGYLTSQVAAEPGKPEPRAARIVSKLREEQSAIGFDRAIAALDPTPRGFYAAADLIGLLYHNASLQGRLGDYPALLELAERPEMKDLAGDIKFNEFLLSRPGFFAILEHPKVKSVLANRDVLEAIQALTPADLLQFVRTGKSDLYGDQPILGRWVVSSAASVAAAFRENPAMNGGEVFKLRARLDSFAGMNFIATPDGKVILRGGGANDTGTWQESGGAYTVNAMGPQGLRFSEGKTMDGRLTLRAKSEGVIVVLDRAQ